MIRTTAFGIGLAIVLICLPGPAKGQEGGATISPSLPGPAETAAGLDKGETDPDSPMLQRRNPRYEVQPDDVLSLSFPLSPEFNQKITIQPDGYVNLQGAGSLYVEGMTVPRLAEAFKKAYSDTLHDPIVDVDLADFHKPFFIVTGQVGKPGQYDLRYDTTVTEAIGIAGGFTPQAKTQVFLYHRVSHSWVEVKKLSVKDILNGKHVNEDAVMQSGDMVFVPEKFIANFRKYVPYTVGTYVSPMSF